MLKPPAHVLAAKDLATAITNIKAWGLMSLNEQKREAEKFKLLPSSEKKRLQRIVNKINPANKSTRTNTTRRRSASSTTSRAMNSNATQQTNSRGDGEEPLLQRPRLGEEEEGGGDTEQPASAGDDLVEPIRHLGLGSRQEDRMALAEERENQIKQYYYRKQGVPCPKPGLQNDAASNRALCSLLSSFSSALTTVELENAEDTENLECTNTFVLVQYCSVREMQKQGGSPRINRSMRADRPLIRVLGTGEVKATAVLKELGKMVSPAFQNNRPDIDLEWIVMEQGVKYQDTVGQIVSRLKESRQLPARQTLTSLQVQEQMPASECLCFYLIFTYSILN